MDLALAVSMGLSLAGSAAEGVGTAPARGRAEPNLGFANLAWSCLDRFLSSSTTDSDPVVHKFLVLGPPLHS